MEQRPVNPREADCHFCRPDPAKHATDPGVTIEHAYGTWPGLEDRWVWAAERFLFPAGAAYATKSSTTTIHDQGKDRRSLVTGAGSHIFAGLLGVIKVRNADHLQPKERKERKEM